MTTRKVWAGMLLALLGLVVPGLTLAQDGMPAARLLQIGPEPSVAAADVPGVSVLSLAGLPEPEAARGAFLSTVLRSNLVSTLVAGPQDLGGTTGQLFLALQGRVGLAPAAEGAGGLTVDVGGTTLAAAEFGGRLRAMVDAVAPAQRQVALFRLEDPDSLFAGHVADFQQAVAASGFALVVVEVGQRPAACRTGADPLVAMAAGLADHVPFGNGDGQTSLAEAADWLTAALARPGLRSAACRDTYAVIVQATEAPDRPVALSVAGALTPVVGAVVQREGFEAKFLLGSDDTSKVAAFLDNCVFCPSERDLHARLDLLRQAEVTRSMEAAIWEDIRRDATPERLQIYLSNCRLCAMRTEAEGLIAAMAAADAAREAEAAAFRRSAGARDLAALRGYVETCVVCADRAAAVALVTEIESDAAVQAEAAALDAALAAQDRAALESWVQTCVTCDRKPAATTELARLTAAQALVAPCLAAAGLPQVGGPRQVSAIVPRLARKACNAALAELPRDARLRVVAARIDQAEGRIDAARAVYDAALAEGVPEAHGLAAYLRFNPPRGTAPDPETAAALARGGAALGDWLSKEVLIQLYTRQMVTGHDPAEALPIARDLAAQGDVAGQFHLGYLLLSGIGAPPDPAQAAGWLERAVAGGHVRARVFLAEILEQGRGVPADPLRAADLMWSALEARDGVALIRLTDQLGDRPAEVIRDIQQRLRDAGAYNGRIDGFYGPGTARAVRAWADTLPPGDAAP
jgi:hypothetical protein